MLWTVGTARAPSRGSVRRGSPRSVSGGHHRTLGPWTGRRRELDAKEREEAVNWDDGSRELECELVYLVVDHFAGYISSSVFRWGKQTGHRDPWPRGACAPPSNGCIPPIVGDRVGAHGPRCTPPSFAMRTGASGTISSRPTRTSCASIRLFVGCVPAGEGKNKPKKKSHDAQPPPGREDGMYGGNVLLFATVA